MADEKVTQLTEDTSLSLTDLMITVQDPTGTAASRKTQLLTLINLIGSTLPDGTMLNGKISVTVSSNDLVVALKTYAGANPSATDPVYVKINGTIRSVTASTSITIANGTSWFGSGSPELGTKLVPYFPYLVWDSNSSIVAISISRISHGRLVSYFSATTTNQAHLFNYANFTSNDDLVNIGYFEATLSLSGTGHLWTVPTFTSANLKHTPTVVSNWMDYVPTWASTGTQPAIGNSVVAGKYMLNERKVTAFVHQVNGNTATYGTGTYSWKLPFTSLAVTGGGWVGPGQIYDASTATTYIGGAFIIAAGASTINIYTHAAAAGIGQTVPVTVAVSDEILFQVDYGI